MEIESEEGERISIHTDSETEIGRRLGFHCPSTGDRTVSRRHLSLRLVRELNDDPRDELSLFFKVIGRNPILVCAAGDGAGTRVYRNSEKGQLRDGDRFSLSLKNPLFFVVKRSEGGGKEDVDQRVLDAVQRREKRTQERRKEKEKEERMMAKAEENGDAEDDEEAANGELELDLGGLDVSNIDPVQEFGFLVKGHEFDHQTRQKIRPPEKWNWFLDEPRRRSDDEDESTDEEGTSLKRKSQRRKKKRGEENEDEEWTDESEDEKGYVGEAETVRRSKYSTRSQDPKRPRKDGIYEKKRSLGGRGVKLRKDGDDRDDEEDESLGGFIVDDKEEEAEAQELDEEVEEEEFDEEEDDDD